MKRKIAALLMGTTLSVAVCGYSVQAMTYGYDMGGKVFISEDSSSSNLTEEEKEKLSDWHKEEMRNELAYLECYGVTYDADSDTLYYQEPWALGWAGGASSTPWAARWCVWVPGRGWPPIWAAAAVCCWPPCWAFR